MVSGHVPEQVPHWMQLGSWSHPATLMISRPKPKTLSASYLIVRLTSIISAFASMGCRSGQLLDRGNIDAHLAKENEVPRMKSHLALPNIHHFLCAFCDYISDELMFV